VDDDDDDQSLNADRCVPKYTYASRAVTSPHHDTIRFVGLRSSCAKRYDAVIRSLRDVTLKFTYLILNGAYGERGRL